MTTEPILDKTILEFSAHGHIAFLMHYNADKHDLRHHLNHNWTTDEAKTDIRPIIAGPPLVVYESVRVPKRPTSILGWAEPNVLVHASLGTGKLSIEINAGSAEAAFRVMRAIQKKYPESDKGASAVWVRFWAMGKDGSASHINRLLAVPLWEDVRDNYAGSTSRELHALAKRTFDKESGGKLILWSGDPGTGKTWAIRAMGREWRKWAELHYVLDPEAFFGDGQYMMRVVLGHDNSNDWDASEEEPDENDPGKWRVIILEDTGELLGRDAKLQTGQGLSRMLNLCDGLIGQGLRVLVLITTNEDLGLTHEAVTRPGRCAANIHFDALSADEVKRWAERHEMPLPGGSRRLAELFELRSGKKVPERRRAGFQRLERMEGQNGQD